MYSGFSRFGLSFSSSFLLFLLFHKCEAGKRTHCATRLGDETRGGLANRGGGDAPNCTQGFLSLVLGI